MSEVTKRYESMIQAMAALHAGVPELAAYLRNLRVNREEWDPGRIGGHCYFDDISEESQTELVEAIAEDADGAIIAVTFHLIGRRGSWAEWYRWDGASVLHWPPTSVRPLPDA